MTNKAVSVCFVCLLFGIFCLIYGQEQVEITVEDTGFNVSKSDLARYEAIDLDIKNELANLKKHDWAGEYYFGDGLGVNVSISLAPKSGFVFTWTGCLGLYDLNYGKVEERQGKIFLVPVLPNKRAGFQGTDTEFYPITWGDRHYLISVRRMIDFINSINGGYESSSLKLFGTSFLLRRTGREKKVSGKPPIPPEFQPYLLAKPIETKIIEVLESVLEEEKAVDYKTRTTTIILDAGSQKGLKKGMEVHVYNPSRIYDSAEIYEVGETTSKAKVVQTVYKDLIPEPPVIGWKLSTNAFKK